MYKQISPNMLKTFEFCQRKFYFQYIKGISIPVNDEIYELGKNIHALASYYLRNENIDKMEKALTSKEQNIWQYLKNSEYFAYKVIGTEYNLSVKVGDNIFGGRLDALVRDGGRYYILDYKTGGAPKDAKYDYQTMIYMLAVKTFYNTDNVTFVYMDLKNRKDVQITYSKQDDSDCEEKLTGIAKKIKALDNPPKKEKCNCEYSIICY